MTLEANTAVLTPVAEGLSYAFRAMGSPCEVRVETEDAALATQIGEIVEAEALRIERKFSRYRPDSALSRINSSSGTPLYVDAETTALLNYAAQCFDLSRGLFDVTSGVLRRVWHFDGSDQVPSREQVADLLPLIGWDKICWRAPEIVLPKGMEIDLGGVGKEYAVDSALIRAMAVSNVPILINFGGDLRVSGPRAGGQRWRIALESVDRSGYAEGSLHVSSGALTTSGDARRFLFKDGVRYSHILNPRTGWPIEHPPRSITVAAPTCMEAGVMSTLAMLHGKKAERFLKSEGLQAWCIRSRAARRPLSTRA